MSIVGSSSGDDAIERMKAWLLEMAEAHASVLDGVKLRPAGYIGKSPQTALVDIIIPGASYQDEAPTIYIDAGEDDWGGQEPTIKFDGWDDVTEKEIESVIHGDDDGDPSDFRALMHNALGREITEPKLDNRQVAEAIAKAPMADAWDAGEPGIHVEVGGRTFTLVEVHQ